METVPLDVFLNGTRDYVQGTQLIASAARAMTKSGHLDAPATVQAAAFHAITDRTVSLDLGQPADTANVMGSVTFLTLKNEKRHAHFIAGDDQAPRANLPPLCTYRLAEASGPLDAVYAVDGVSNTEQFLIAFIQAMKERHQALTQTISDIWFTGLRGANIPVAEHFPAQNGTMSLSLRRLMSVRDRWQTMMRFSMDFPDGRRLLEGTSTFAFKSESKPNVD